MKDALPAEALETLRQLIPSIVAHLTRRSGDFAAAEDATQEALLAALSQWPRDGVPHNPAGWLMRVASRRLIDQTRAALARRQREALVISLVSPEDQLAMTLWSEPEGERDDALELMFMCCHPALSPTSAIALTLRAFGGLTTAEIAHAFLVPEPTMAQRISRAKKRLDQERAELHITTSQERDARLTRVAHVLYLMFNEGYTASSGEALTRVELSAEAIRLTRTLHRLIPHHEELAGLLALMLLTDARRPARTGAQGELIPLDEQDRSRWSASHIAEGVALLEATLPRGRLGPYQIQAAIAAVHDEAPSAEQTDWPQLFGLYTLLLRQMPESDVVALNHAVALAMVRGAEVGLARMKALAPGYRRDAAMAHLHEQIEDFDEAARLYRRAAQHTTSQPERDYLLMRAARLTSRAAR